ncbi:MFS transporter [Frigoriflavimonas asaccharolytica]|uniref:ACS family hexuronate transporter-like MFS transporter n=1 Tax=Frigoriflavimonas asaccharolytica TaxID=2735899 RepID=A0A8J8GAI0_9FLAO|nr:MFS transporter [Frigoriflavimonas asaccharolytica]NRS92624.1 ACS family hexuronate transporter-like MFS transporter [Frigoriflavimonas asaccharolytica]
MKLTGLRWWVVTLIAIATIINYIDRTSLSVLWPEIAKELYPDHSADETKSIYAIISIIFVFSYAIGQAIFGKIFDWIGTRLGFVLSIGVWSVATALHAFAQGVLSFGIFRAILGVAEAGNWPGATKGNAEWFPTKERALAQGIFNSGAAIGGIISIPLIAYLTVYFDWKMIFVLIGAAGLLWLVPWWILVKAPPEKHPWITDKEREYILTGQRNEDFDGDGDKDQEYNPNTKELLSHKQSWGVILASAAIDPIWWLFVFWIPIYLNEVYGMDVKSIGLYGWVPYAGAMLGAWFGGLFAQNRLKAGWNITKTRKTIITIGCLIMLPALIAMLNPGGPTSAVMIMAVILFGFQTAIGNIQTLTSDLFSGKTVGSLSGYSGMAAKLSAAGLTYLVPWLTSGGNYTPAFAIGAGLAVVTLASIWILVPKVEPVTRN